MARENESNRGTNHGGSGNFKNDPKRASEAGHKGGQHSGGGDGNFKNNPDKASEAGHKGGQQGHGGHR